MPLAKAQRRKEISMYVIPKGSLQVLEKAVKTSAKILIRHGGSRQVEIG